MTRGPYGKRSVAVRNWWRLCTMQCPVNAHVWKFICWRYYSPFFVIRFVLVHIPARTYFFILVSGTPLAHQFVSSYQCDTSARVLSGPRIMADPFNLNVWSPRSSPHPPRSITVVACTFNLSHQWCYILFRIRFLLVLTRSTLWSVRHFK